MKNLRGAAADLVGELQDGPVEILAPVLGLGGANCLSNATCLIRLQVFYARFVASRIIIPCRMFEENLC